MNNFILNATTMRPGNFIYIILIFYFSYNNTVVAQQENYKVSGFVTDSISGERLIGTNILLYKDSLDLKSSPLTGTSTNSFGFFAIPSLNSGTYYLIFRHLGYKPVIRQLHLASGNNLSMQVLMIAEDIKLKEVVITGKKISKNVSNLIDVPPELLANLPSFTGEADLFRSLEMLPGVNKASELSSGLYIRGGSQDQTLTLVDGVVVYNPAHLGNISSTFNTNALQDVKLIKGGFPAEYGGRLSSVLDVKLRSGTKEKESGILGIGLINSFASLEGPLSTNGTYMVSVRGMYYDFLQKNFNAANTVPRYNFFDVSGKINYLTSGTSSISIAGLYNNDHAYSSKSVKETDYDIEWSNLNLSLNWQQVNSSSLFLNSVFSYVNYKFSSKIGIDPASNTSYTYFTRSDLKDFGFRQNAEIRWQQQHTFKTGIEITLHNYDLLYSDIYIDALEKDPFAGSNITSIEAALYFQNESQFASSFWANYGGRLYYFNNKKYFSFEPRISLSYHFNENLIFKSAFAIAHQFIHLIVRNDITLPTDLWYPSTKNIEPGKSIQYSVGLDSYWQDQEYLITLESYYKSMYRLYEFVNNPTFDPVDKKIEDQFTEGDGESYGIELFINKRKGKFRGWLGYTISWTKRQFDNLNNGRVFYPRYDRRHDVSAALTYMLFENLNLGATWTYATGQWYTLPPGQYLFNPIGTGQDPAIQFNYSDINTVQFPEYHKLDLNINYSFTWLSSSFDFYINLYNVYNRSNAFARYIVLAEGENDEMIPVVKQITLFPFIPSFGLKVKF